MVKIGGYKEETARLILEVVRYLKDSGYVISRPGRGERNLVPPEVPIYIRNDTGEIIPSFGCVQVTGTVELGGQNYITVDKPVDITGTAGGYLFNGIAPIEIGGYGIAYDGPEVRMLTNGTTVTCGELWQPAIDSFAVVPGGSMFSAIGEDDIEDDVMRAFVSKAAGGATIQFTVDSIATAITTSPYNGKKVATVTVTVAPCSRADLIGETVEVVDWSGCVWDRDEADLIGVWGWASEYVAESLAAGASPGELTPCHWGADDRCCVAADSEA